MPNAESTGPQGSGSNDLLGPLPETDVWAIGSLDTREDVYAYSAEAMEAERQRCYALGMAAERERWEATVRRMHAADDRYGCGFYNDDEWRAAYDELRAMCGPNAELTRPP